MPVLPAERAPSRSARRVALVTENAPRTSIASAPTDGKAKTAPKNLALRRDQRLPAAAPTNAAATVYVTAASACATKVSLAPHAAEKPARMNAITTDAATKECASATTITKAKIAAARRAPRNALVMVSVPSI